MASFLNQNFDDDESGDDDFNPGSAHGSDDEGGDREVKGEKQSRRGSDIQRSSDDEKPNLKSNGLADTAEDEAEEAENGEEDDGEAGDEDAEGEGEDLGNDEDDDEEEDEDDEDAVGRPRKRLKRRPGNQFIDAEAEVDDEEDEEEPEEDDVEAEDAHPDDVDLPPGADTDDRHHRELDRAREVAASMDAEAQAKMYQTKYGKRSNRTAEVSAIPQHLLLPSVDDPSIWAVKCKAGKENEVVAQIYRNYFNLLRLPERFHITSAFARGGQQAGFVYVEALRQEDVLKATDGIAHCYNRGARGVSNLQKITISEMPDLLRVRKPKNLDRGMWVRILRPPKYAGDLGQIDSVDTNGTDLTVKLVPRIDYGGDEDLNAPQNILKRKRKPRPPQRLFNEAEARKKLGRGILHRADNLRYKHYTIKNDNFIDGYLYKDFKVSQIEAEHVKPTMEEMLRFSTGSEDGSESLDIGQMATMLRNDKSGADLQADDLVEIYKGEAVGVKGKVTTIQNGIATITVTKGRMTGQTIESPVNTVRKLFELGSRVKVISGAHRDAEGLVVDVKGDKVAFLDDAHTRIEVFSRDLRDASAATGAQFVSRFSNMDLVQLDASTVAVVIKVDPEIVTVRDQNDKLRKIPESSIPKKAEVSRFAVATDRDGNELRQWDIVREAGGQSRQGEIVHIWRNILFLHDKTNLVDGGLFVVRAHSVNTIVAKAGEVRNAGPDLTKMNPMLKQNGANGGAGGAMAPPKFAARNFDQWRGKTIKVRTGPLKGRRGRVQVSNGETCTVEFEGMVSGPKNREVPIKGARPGPVYLINGQVANIPIIDLIKIDPVTHQALDERRTPYSRAPPNFSRAPPGFGTMPARPAAPASAMDGGRTPGYLSGGMTPAHRFGGGDKTPAWGNTSSTFGSSRNDGSRTEYAGGRTEYSGGRTAYGGATSYGGATPAWGGIAGAGSNRFGSGSHTPAWSGASSTVPDRSTGGAWGRTDAPTPGARYGNNTLDAAATPAAASAPTPAALSAPTPGASHGGLSAGRPTPYDSGPTPRPYDAPTPGVYAGAPTPAATGDGEQRDRDRGRVQGYAPTPAATAATPGAWAAETPGANWDDGPRYD